MKFSNNLYVSYKNKFKKKIVVFFIIYLYILGLREVRWWMFKLFSCRLRILDKKKVVKGIFISMFLYMVC